MMFNVIVILATCAVVAFYVLMMVGAYALIRAVTNRRPQSPKAITHNYCRKSGSTWDW